MNTLNDNWLTENLIDFEYKKYTLLGYLQKVKQHFKEKKLYPDLTDLIKHYKNLVSLKENTGLFESGFKKQLKSVDFENKRLVYESTLNDEILNELKEIIAFSEPLLCNELKNGKEIFDYAEKHIVTTEVGIEPLYKNEGYIFLQEFNQKVIAIYNYHLSRINLLNEQVYGLQCQFLDNMTITLTKPIDKIKHEMIEQYPHLPNPAVYHFIAKTPLPNNETFLPIVKRILYYKLAKN